jgi:hypothetical protein
MNENNCIIFCRYKEGKVTKEELRVLLDLHEEEEYKIVCSICSEEIKF